jgi:hypothetical protein
LSLVDDEPSQPAFRKAGFDVPAQFLEKLRLRIRSGRAQGEAAREKLVELRAIQRRIRGEETPVLRAVQLAQHCIQDRRFSTAGLANEEREATRRREAIAQIAEDLALPRCEEQVSRVWREIEWTLS